MIQKKLQKKVFEDIKTNKTKNISIALEVDVSNTNLINYEITDYNIKYNY